MFVKRGNGHALNSARWSGSGKMSAWTPESGGEAPEGRGGGRWSYIIFCEASHISWNRPFNGSPDDAA